jgi:hypothetical protein
VGRVSQKGGVIGSSSGGFGSSNSSGLAPGPTGRTITSLKVTYGGVPLSSSRSASALELSAAAAAAAAMDTPPVKTGTGRPRGRPRKHPLPAGLAAAPAAPAAPAGTGSLQPQQLQQHRVQWQDGYQSAAAAAGGPGGGSERSTGGPGSSLGSGGSLTLQRKRSSSFSGLDDASPNLKVKVRFMSTLKAASQPLHHHRLHSWTANRAGVGQTSNKYHKLTGMPVCLYACCLPACVPVFLCSCVCVCVCVCVCG